MTHPLAEHNAPGQVVPACPDRTDLGIYARHSVEEVKVASQDLRERVIDVAVRLLQGNAVCMSMACPLRHR